jgi:hypothetical protein
MLQTWPAIPGSFEPRVVDKIIAGFEMFLIRIYEHANNNSRVNWPSR